MSLARGDPAQRIAETIAAYGPADWLACTQVIFALSHFDLSSLDCGPACAPGRHLKAEPVALTPGQWRRLDGLFAGVQAGVWSVRDKYGALLACRAKL